MHEVSHKGDCNRVALSYHQVIIVLCSRMVLDGTRSKGSILYTNVVYILVGNFSMVLLKSKYFLVLLTVIIKTSLHSVF